MQQDQRRIHQCCGDDSLCDAHRNGLPTHPFEGAEPELVADDKGNEAQRHLCEDAVAFHLSKAAKAKAQPAQDTPER